MTSHFPLQSKHGFWFDIQDVTGTTLSAKARFQINIKVPNLESFSDLSKVKTAVIPILWLDEGIDQLGPEIVGLLKKAVTEPREWKQIILYAWSGSSFVLRSAGKLPDYFRSLCSAALLVLPGRGEVSPGQGQRQPGGAGEGEGEGGRGEVDDERHEHDDTLSELIAPIPQMEGLKVLNQSIDNIR